MPFSLKKLGVLPATFSMALLAGCANYLPESGPDGDNVAHRAAVTTVARKSTVDLPYSFVEIDSSKLAVLHALTQRGDLRLAPTEASAGGRIGVGDVLDISIFEADTGGLFTASPSETRLGNAITLPAQEVDHEGFVMVPYAGRVRAAGQTPSELARLIVADLKGQALDPQVVVGFGARHSGSVSVLGDVYTAAHFCLDAGGERLLGALARAGGPRSADYETEIQLERAGEIGRAKLSDIIANPEENVPIAPGDMIYVSHRPDYFIALGATGQSVSLGPVDRRIPFGASHLTLADALARAGGLQDDRANPKAVFVFRYESTSTLRALGITSATLAPRAPVVYAVNLRDPAGLFYASGFEVQPEDIIYAADASAADAAKIETLLLPIVEAGVTAAVIH